MEHKLILASASKARFGVLTSAGKTPKGFVRDCDEDNLLSTIPSNVFQPDLQVNLLALGKAVTVIKTLIEYSKTNDLNTLHDTTNLDSTKPVLADETTSKHFTEKVLVACDSMLEVDGKMFGKPKTKDTAIERAKNMRNKTTILHTGHVLVKIDYDVLKSLNSADIQLPVVYSQNDIEKYLENFPLPIVADCDSTAVTFDDNSDEEIIDYVNTGEPLHVAGGFTIDGYGSAFIKKIDGDYNNVIGISPRVVKRLCSAIGVQYTQLWD